MIREYGLRVRTAYKPLSTVSLTAKKADSSSGSSTILAEPDSEGGHPFEGTIVLIIAERKSSSNRKIKNIHWGGRYKECWRTLISFRVSFVRFQGFSCSSHPSVVHVHDSQVFDRSMINFIALNWNGDVFLISVSLYTRAEVGTLSGKQILCSRVFVVIS